MIAPMARPAAPAGLGQYPAPRGLRRVRSAATGRHRPPSAVAISLLKTGTFPGSKGSGTEFVSAQLVRPANVRLEVILGGRGPIGAPGRCSISREPAVIGAKKFRDCSSENAGPRIKWRARKKLCSLASFRRACQGRGREWVVSIIRLAGENADHHQKRECGNQPDPGLVLEGGGGLGLRRIGHHRSPDWRRFSSVLLCPNAVVRLRPLSAQLP